MAFCPELPTSSLRLETSRWDLSNYNDFITATLDNSGGRLRCPQSLGSASR